MVSKTKFFKGKISRAELLKRAKRAKIGQGFDVRSARIKATKRISRLF